MCALGLAVMACTCQPPAPREINHASRAIFSAAAELHHAELKIHIEQWRKSGLLPPKRSSDSFVVESLIAALPVLAVHSDNPEARMFYAHGAVATWLLREWDAWPTVLELGIYASPPELRQPEMLMGSGLVILAVDPKGADPREFLRGVAAIDRAARIPRFQEREGIYCLETLEPENSPCANAGEGWLAIGSWSDLSRLREKVPSPSRAELEHDSSAPLAAPPTLLSARLQLPGFSSGTLVLSRPGDLLLEAGLSSTSEDEARQLEKVISEVVALLKSRFHQAHQLLEPATRESRASLEGDHEAPQSLRLLASGLNPQAVIDREGRLRSLSESLMVSRQESDLSFSARISPLLARQILAESQNLVTLASVGLAASMLWPKWGELQCRSRQLEVRSSLEAAFAHQQARLSRGEVPAVDFSELGFEADPDSRYTYCMGDECLPCLHPSCPPPRLNPCSSALLMNLAMPGQDLFVCAFGLPRHPGPTPSELSAEAGLEDYSVDSLGLHFEDRFEDQFEDHFAGEGLDIWIIGDSGLPLNIADACSPLP